MKDIRQIQLINKQLNNELSKQMGLLVKINSMLDQKNLSHEKMKGYLDEYLNSKKLDLTRVTPGLNKNIHLFISKLNEILQQSEEEIKTLNGSRQLIIEKITLLEKKIDVMNQYESDIQIQIRKKQDKMEQAVVDDMVATIDIRKENE